QPQAQPLRLGAMGQLEQWDGQYGPGPLQAAHAMDRALALAHQGGIGLVALRHTNHWMRGGAYGWQAAEAGCLALCWTNTMPNMLAWGAEPGPVLGNNPLILAVPGPEGAHLVLDMAMSQFSFGKMATYQAAGESLPVPAGLDDDGQPTRDPATVLTNMRALPIGYWKGSGLSFMLDLFASVLSLGLATHEVTRPDGAEAGLSQIFVAIDPEQLGPGLWQARVQAILDHFAQVADSYLPGARTLALRQQHAQEGVPVSEATWTRIQALTAVG
ncbi:MAG: 2,3-diketo-L-gulonate reductase, partial [Bacteroidetes bacterium]